MTKPVVFYYSRRKLGLYLLANIVLLALAGLFTWIIFPEYSIVYGYALITCAISLLASLIVFIFPMKLAVLDDEQIKIDHDEPISWSQIKDIEKEGVVCCGIDRSIIRLVPYKLANYHKSLMQRLTNSSRFGMFSIPLYAMDKKSAAQITKMIEEHVKSADVAKGRGKVGRPAKTTSTKAPAKDNKTAKTKTATAKSAAAKGKKAARPEKKASVAKKAPKQRKRVTKKRQTL
ncbi:MAG: hypothetical protein IJ184_03780 [Alphaproteobacteria bacterium]|nr:hypothetical protein [Alphaproteobacteria bacterium]